MPAINVFESKYVRNCLHGGWEDPSTRKILEGGTTFLVGLHAEMSVCLEEK